MSRFHLAAQADADLDAILDYLNQCSRAYRDRISEALENMLFAIGQQPYLGAQHSEFTRLLGEEVRSRIVSPYRIFYRMKADVPEVLAVLHTARNLQEVFAERLQ